MKVAILFDAGSEEWSPQDVAAVVANVHEVRDVLRRLLRSDAVKNAIVFSNRKTTVRELNKSLRQNGFASGEIHGDMDQSSRIKELDRFKAKSDDLGRAARETIRHLDALRQLGDIKSGVPIEHPDGSPGGRLQIVLDTNGTLTEAIANTPPFDQPMTAMRRRSTSARACR